jgi:ABC-type multidrug transport system permease subunit
MKIISNFLPTTLPAKAFKNLIMKGFSNFYLIELAFCVSLFWIILWAILLVITVKKQKYFVSK